MKRYSQILFYSVVALWGFVLLELIVRYPCNHGPDSRDMIPWFCVTFLMSLPLLLCEMKVSLLCLFLSLGGVVAMIAGDVFNVMVPYDTWTERGMPEMFTLALRTRTSASHECPNCTAVHVEIEPNGVVWLNGSTYAIADKGREGGGVQPPSALADLLKGGNFSGKAFSIDLDRDVTGSDIMRALKFFRDCGISNLDFKRDTGLCGHMVESLDQACLSPSENAKAILKPCVQRLMTSCFDTLSAVDAKELVGFLSYFADAGRYGATATGQKYSGPLTVKDVNAILGSPSIQLCGDRVLVHRVYTGLCVSHSIITCYDGYVLIGVACIKGDRHENLDAAGAMLP